MTGAHSGLVGCFQRFRGVKTPAWQHMEGELTFDGLHRGALQLADRIARLQGGDRRPVLIYAHKNRRFPIAYWAALLLGRPIVPVEPDTPPLRLLEIARQAEAGLLLAAVEASAELPDLPCPVLAVELPTSEDADAGEAEALPAVSVSDLDVCYIMFSSGTSGAAKGIQLSYDNLHDFGGWLSSLHAEFGVPDAVSGNVRHCFDVSLFELWTSWQTLKPLTALDHRTFADPAAHIRQLRSSRTGWWVSTPSMIRFYLKNRDFTAETLPDLGVFLFCGEVLPKETVTKIWERFPRARIFNTYGPTECTVAVTGVEITPDHLTGAGALPIGQARPGTHLSLRADMACQHQPSGGVGEIVISGRSVGLGYLGLPDRQRRAFPAPSTYRTGDQGHADADGIWHFHGRLDREVKIQGVRIDLNAIEGVIRGHAGVEDVVVDVLKIHGEARGLKAFVVGPDTQQDLARLARDVSERLPPQYLPRRWYGGLTEQLNLNGKLDRDLLASLAESNAVVHVQAPSGLSL